MDGRAQALSLVCIEGVVLVFRGEFVGGRGGRQRSRVQSLALSAWFLWFFLVAHKSSLCGEWVYCINEHSERTRQ
jgi:hypothetical protein